LQIDYENVTMIEEVNFEKESMKRIKISINNMIQSMYNDE